MEFLSAIPVYGFALIVRVLLILYGGWQDANMIVKYTDVDYFVFNDAARFVTEGNSPYMRSTYRYTPLLAYILTPNIFIHESFGKVLFAITDLAIGYFLQKILNLILPRKDKEKPVDERTMMLYISIWLFNPIAINVSTRGNAESIVSVLVVMALYYIMTNRIILGSIIFGLSVHFKIYPLMYAFPLLFYIDCEKASSMFYPTKNRIKFALISAGTFFAITGIMYWIYGFEFLYESYLYHLIRKDHRHNFSVYFYYLYLSSVNEVSTFFTRLAALLAFIPQIVVVFVCFTHKYYRDICFCIFVQTFAFVAFNKVCTVQYFIWYFSLLPLVIPFTDLKARNGIWMFVGWLGSQLLWLNFAYELEFLGKNTFFQVWFAGIVFFVVNIWMLGQFLTHHKPNKIKQP